MTNILVNNTNVAFTIESIIVLAVGYITSDSVTEFENMLIFNTFESDMYYEWTLLNTRVVY